MMNSRYLEVTYRRGVPIAAYFYLDRPLGEVRARTESAADGFQIDYAADGRAIGIELTAPTKVTLAALNSALAKAGEPPASAVDLAPLNSLSASTDSAFRNSYTAAQVLIEALRDDASK